MGVLEGVPVHKNHEILVLRAGFVVFSGSFPGQFFCCMRGPSLVELTGDDGSVTSTVAVERISPKEYV